MPSLKIEFFHDVVCGWCFVLAPRLKQLQDELDLDIQHRTFILQTSREAMIERFGSMPQAKQTILDHWRSCAHAEEVKRIDIEGMRRQPFEYPSGLLAGLACQAATALDGNEGHGRMFDHLQEAHLVQSRNIGDHDTVLTVATEAGFDPRAFALAFHDLAPRMLDQELTRGERLGITSVPSLVIDGRYLLPGALSLEALRSAIARVRDSVR
ncbi:MULTISPECIES: DsbA family protein [unclassified Pseudomonas]|uniref:DsbA family oxidoreductase n=1 Tax=unclassified Pseudomonas TaxID=196821 RepID=UPI002448319A|nr:MULTISPECIES: DsbA family protein [unclassified Pseudomonas]MDH0300259.1 DsbA family protein [Pseudomonas sp. GD04091]MDH1987717.1 DsbA family protein [Pseudomonas sp. GD03689]